jgi:hypothetical protein
MSHGFISPGQMNVSGCLMEQKFLIDRLINELQLLAAPGNIISGFRRTGICPFNPQISLHSDFTIEVSDPSIFETISTGTEINEMLLTNEQGLNTLSRIEFRRDWRRDAQINYRLTWETLIRKTVLEGRSLSQPPLLFIRDDAHTIEGVDITTLPI